MKNLIPTNLQYFAEEAEAPENTEVKQEEAKEPENKEVSATELNDKLQEALVELAKVKKAQEKAASEAAEYKKKWKESLSVQEQANMEKAEEQAKRDEEFESMKKRLAINDLVGNYMDRGYPKDVAQKIAQARYEGDIDTERIIEKQMDEAKAKKLEEQILASRPEINVGTGQGKGITKEQFDNMSLIEKSKLRRDNKEEYDRLVAL